VEPRLLVTADVLPGSIAETALLAAVVSQTTLSTVLAMRPTAAVWTADRVIADDLPFRWVRGFRFSLVRVRVSH
jgi:hypothetical protein